MRAYVLALLFVACADDPAPHETVAPLACARSEVSLTRGTTVWTEVDTFDGARRVRTVRTAVDAARAQDHAIDYVYDAQGRVIEERHDDGANGDVDWTVTWTFDAGDDWTLKVSTWPVWSVRHERDFDAEGRLVAERVDDFDDGDWDLIATQTWVEGALVRRVEDQPNVAPPEVVIDYHYDAGRLVLEERDRGDDGVDTHFTRAYDAVGRLMQWAWRDPDDAWVEGSTAERDAAGHIVAIEWDSTLDGFERSTFTHDADGNLLAQELAYGEHGAADTRWTWTAGCSERVRFE